MPDSPKTQTVVQQLVDCIYAGCCNSAATTPIVTPTACNIAYGHTGETISTLTPAAPLVV